MWLPLVLALACSDKATPTDDTAPMEDDSTAPSGGALAFSESPRNVLFIALDTTRRDVIGRFSGDAAATPNLDALLAEGVVLEDHRSCSNWTWDSVLCVQSGQDPWRLGFAYVDESGVARSSVPADVRLMSSVVRDAGYQTALATAQGYMSPDNRMSQGFDDSWYVLDAPATELTDGALDLLSGFDPAEPWYLHLHYMDPHELYDPPEAYLDGLDGLDPIDFDLTVRTEYEALRAGAIDEMSEAERELVLAHLWVRYLAELKYFDDQLGRLLDTMEAGGWLDDTLVVFWTDHGEQIWQHGYSTHGGSLFEEEIRATAAFWAKGLTPLAWTEPTTHVDLWPTIAVALGLPNTTTFTGVPVGRRDDDAALFSLRYRGPKSFQSVVQDDKKLFYNWNGSKEYYDLAADPGELANVYDSTDPDVVALWELLAPQLEAVEAAMGGASPVDPGP